MLPGDHKAPAPPPSFALLSVAMATGSGPEQDQGVFSAISAFPEWPLAGAAT